mmetsp:Transcript_45970/g.68404  ORF Transcript_45970/g.68404 Transcript_45970/m.68404 type:complete len:210 (-) Transcript_45970:276-905(-)
MSAIVTIYVTIYKKTQRRVSHNHLFSAQVAMMNTINFGNQGWLFHMYSSLVFFVRIVVLMNSLFCGIQHDFCKRFPGWSKSTTVTTPISKEIHKDKLMFPPGILKSRAIQTNSIFSIGMQLFDRRGNLRIDELNVMLQLIPMNISLRNPRRINSPLLNILGNILFLPQDTHNINGCIVAFEIQHGNVEIYTEFLFICLVQGQVRDERRL